MPLPFAADALAPAAGTFLYNTKPYAPLSDGNVRQYYTAYKVMGKFDGSKSQLRSKNAQEIPHSVLVAKSTIGAARKGHFLYVEGGAGDWNLESSVCRPPWASFWRRAPRTKRW